MSIKSRREREWERERKEMPKGGQKYVLNFSDGQIKFKVLKKKKNLLPLIEESWALAVFFRKTTN